MNTEKYCQVIVDITPTVVAEDGAIVNSEKDTMSFFFDLTFEEFSLFVQNTEKYFAIMCRSVDIVEYEDRCKATLKLGSKMTLYHYTHEPFLRTYRIDFYNKK